MWIINVIAYIVLVLFALLYLGFMSVGTITLMIPSILINLVCWPLFWLLYSITSKIKN